MLGLDCPASAKLLKHCNKSYTIAQWPSTSIARGKCRRHRAQRARSTGVRTIVGPRGSRVARSAGLYPFDVKLNRLFTHAGYHLMSCNFLACTGDVVQPRRASLRARTTNHEVARRNPARSGPARALNSQSTRRGSRRPNAARPFDRQSAKHQSARRQAHGLQSFSKPVGRG